MVLVSLGAFAVTYSITDSMVYAMISALVSLFAIALLMKKGVIKKEGFNVFTSPLEISGMLRKLKEGFTGKDEEEDFKDKDEEEGFKDEEEDFKDKDEEEGFKDKDEQDEAEDESNESGSKAEVDGYEDVKVEKNEKPAPAMKADENPMPFKLGEIPSQAKGGPHIDAGSTLMKAIKSLNPDQINAMSKDTQQLIETQKSLMGMLGTMKPMLNDGKELMNTFQQMFGQ
jgi:hypothetical protein